MLFAIIGVIMIALKAFGVSVMADISWFWCTVPFIFAFIYWEFIDPAFQITARREVKEQKIKNQKQRKKQAEETFGRDHVRRFRK